jgi:hypothetical protein
VPDRQLCTNIHVDVLLYKGQYHGRAPSAHEVIVHLHTQIVDPSVRSAENFIAHEA